MKKVIATENAPKAVGPYSQAIEVNGTLYISGQIPVNPADGKVQEDIVFPWNEENAPITITTSALRVDNWYEYNKMAGPIPYSLMYGMPVSKTPEQIQLIPYGCTTLRITQFPLNGQHTAEESITE